MRVEAHGIHVPHVLAHDIDVLMHVAIAHRGVASLAHIDYLLLPPEDEPSGSLASTRSRSRLAMKLRERMVFRCSVLVDGRDVLAVFQGPAR